MDDTLSDTIHHAGIAVDQAIVEATNENNLKRAILLLAYEVKLIREGLEQGLLPVAMLPGGDHGRFC